jgi:hypothetical protein
MWNTQPNIGIYLNTLQHLHSSFGAFAYLPDHYRINIMESYKCPCIYAFHFFASQVESHATKSHFVDMCD